MAISDWFRRKPKALPPAPEERKRSSRVLHQRSDDGSDVSLSGAPNWDATQALNFLFNEPAFYAAVNIRTQAAATPQPVLYRSNQANPFSRWSELKGGYGVRKAAVRHLHETKDIVQVHEHDILDLFSRPSHNMTGFMMRKMWHLYLYVVGENFLIKDAGSNDLQEGQGLYTRPQHLIMQSPQHCHVPDSTSRYFRFRKPGTLSEKKYTPEQVVWSKQPNPLDLNGRGMGVAQALFRELCISNQVASTVHYTMANRAMPRMHFKVDDEDMTDEEFREAQKDLKNEYGGVQNSGKNMVTSKRVEASAIAQNLIEGDAIALRRQSMDFILAYTGVPRELLGITNDGNRATAESAMDRLHIGCTIPMCEFFRLEMQEKVVKDWGANYILDFETPLREDKQEKLERMKCMPEGYTINEWRSATGDESLGEAGEVYFINGEFHKEFPVAQSESVDLPDVE